MKKIASLLAISLLMAVLTSCGYHFTQVGGIIPPTAKTIAISVFINNTFEPYIDVNVTEAVVNEFLTDGRLRVVSSDAADIVIQGKVTKFETIPQTYSVAPYVLSYNVSITVTITVIDARTQRVLLQDSAVTSIFSSTYAVTLENVSQTKLSKSVAVTNACQDIASTIRSRVLEGF